MKRTALFFVSMAAGIFSVDAAYIWIGNNLATAPGGSAFGGDGSSLYAENNWENDANPGFPPAADAINNSSQPIPGINNSLIVSNGRVAGGANGAGSNTALMRTNGNPVSISGVGSGLKMAVTGGGVASYIENDGSVGGSRSVLTVSDGGFVTTGKLVDIATTLNGAGSAVFFLGAGDNGLAGNNSTIDLVVGTRASSPAVYWGSITAEQLFVSGVLSSITVNGTAAVWGTDPLVEEAGDNVLFTATTFNRLGNNLLPQNNYYTTSRAGFSMVAVPEPGAALFGLVGAGLLVLRRRQK